MFSTQIVKIQLVESSMDEISKFAGVGGFRAITEILSFLRRLHKTSFENAVKTNPHFLGETLAHELANAKLSLEEIKLIDDKRPANRDLIRANMISLLQKNRKLPFDTISEVITQASSQSIIKVDGTVERTDVTNYFTSDEITVLRTANLLLVDREWVFQSLNMNALKAILDNTNMSVSAAFDFFDSLNKDAKTNIDVTLLNLQSYIIDKFKDWHTFGISIEQHISEIEAIFAATSFNDSRYASTAEPDNSKWLKFCFTDELNRSLQNQAIYSKLSKLSSEFTTIVSNQPITIAKSILYKFVNLMLMKVKPQYHIFKKPEMLTIIPSHENLVASEMETLARQIISDTHTDSSFFLKADSAKEFVHTLFFNYASTVTFAKKYFNPNNETTIDAKILERITDTPFQNELLSEIQKRLIRIQCIEELDAYYAAIGNTADEDKIHYLIAFEGMLQCYLINQTAAMCESFWKTAINMTSNTLENVTQAVEQVALPAISATQSKIDLPSTESPLTANSMLPYYIVSGAALVATGLAFAFFKCKKPSKKSYEPLQEVMTTSLNRSGKRE